jgi:RHS repeat-associated protein
MKMRIFDLGNVITAIQNNTQQIETNRTTEVSYSYPPFGSTGTPSTASLNSFRYTGREASDNTQLYYYRGRYYSPTISRFIQEEPLGLIAEPNVYAYVLNDPLNNADPLGLDLTPAQQAAVVSAAQDWGRF